MESKIMKSNHFTAILVLITLIVSSCSNKMSPGEYIDWIEDEDNGLRVSKETNAASYTLQYETADYKALLSMGPENVSKTNLMAGREKFVSMHHFLLQIKPKSQKVNGNQSFTEYLAYNLEEHIRFIRGEDTLKRTVMYHLESPAGVQPHYNILLAYPRKQKRADLQINIKSNKMDKNKVEFVVSEGALSDLPQIDIVNE